MNTPSTPRRCPVCHAEIPAHAPQGLCPKCLLQQVAAADITGLEGAEPATVAGQKPSETAPARQNGNPRPAPPAVEDLAAAFPQLEVLELIGRGGMGFVYKARQPKLDRLVALKILPNNLANEPSFHERFEREARVLAKLQHPQIVSVYDFGEALVRPHASGIDPASVSQTEVPRARGEALPKSYYYLMLEYVDGVNLREAMRIGRFTPEQALAIVPQICEALQYAHSRGVLHRDIKPENILLDVSGHVKIADFGIAKALAHDFDSPSHLPPGAASESEIAVTRLTATGSILGTPLYMAPEQLINPNTVDHRADIYSLGVVFYEMLTGELPMGRFAPPSAKTSIDERIDEVVMRALAKERELRQQSAREMKTEVETIVSQPQPRRRPGDKESARGSTEANPDASMASMTSEAIRKDLSSGAWGWWALAALAVGCQLAVLPFMTMDAVVHRGSDASPPPGPSMLGILLMLIVTSLSVVAPIALGWTHLITQHHQRGRRGIIPAMIAAWFLPLLALNLVIVACITYLLRQGNAGSPGNHESVAVLVVCFVVLLCLVVDAAVLLFTWKWVTQTTFSNFRLNYRGEAAETGRRPLLGLSLILAAVVFTIIWGMCVSFENRRLTGNWFHEITAAQHEWQRATNELNLQETQWRHWPKLPESPTPEQSRRYDAEKKEFSRKSELLGKRIAELEGRMAVLSTMGNFRNHLTTFLPLALFAIPPGVAGLLLLFRQRNRWFSVATAIGSLIVLYIAILILSERMFVAAPPMVNPRYSFQDDIGHEPFQKLEPERNASPAVQPGPAKPSAAAVAAGELKLIKVVDAIIEVWPVQQPIVLTGDSGQKFVEPNFSALVRLSGPDKTLRYSVSRGSDTQETRSVLADYPCDYVSCEWPGDGLPRLCGYLAPPAAFDFRSDPGTGFPGASLHRAEIAERVLKLVVDRSASLEATETDWQDALQKAHLRFKLVPKEIALREAPDECLVVLTEGASTILTRTASNFLRFTGIPLDSIQQIRSILESTKSVDQSTQVRALLKRAEKAVNDRNWKALCDCLTDDGRDEWILEITTGCDLALSMAKDAQGSSGAGDSRELALLAQMQTALKNFKRKIDPEVAKELDSRFQTYLSLSQEDRRRFRIDVLRANYSDLPAVATTVLSMVQQVDEKTPILDFSTATVSMAATVNLDEGVAIANWSSSDGKRRPITFKQQRSGGESTWKIDSVVGKSVLDPPYPTFFSFERQAADGRMNDETLETGRPADATRAENTDDAPPGPR